MMKKTYLLSHIFPPIAVSLIAILSGCCFNDNPCSETNLLRGTQADGMALRRERSILDLYELTKTAAFIDNTAGLHAIDIDRITEIVGRHETVDDLILLAKQCESWSRYLDGKGQLPYAVFDDAFWEVVSTLSIRTDDEAIIALRNLALGKDAGGSLLFKRSIAHQNRLLPETHRLKIHHEILY